MELQLGLSHPDQAHIHGIKRKPAGFQDPCYLTNNELPQTLPLLSWNDHNPKDDQQYHPPRTPFSTFQIDHEEDNNHPVGWPPIESWRRKAVHCRPQLWQAPPENRRPVGSNSHNFVKVKMEGIVITRKLDLGLYHSHHSLKTALISMFSTYPTIHDNGWVFTLIYEDKYGDWLLAEDLPWNSFVESVQRLKILVRKGNKE